MPLLLSIAKLLISPLFLFSLALIIVISYVCRGGTNFLNISKVFKDYFDVFRDAKSHVMIFWGVPVLLSAATTQVVMIDRSLAETLIIFLSILISAFFAMLSILTDKQTNKESSTLYTSVLKETSSTVLFEIVLCIIALLISLCIIFLETVCPQIIILFLCSVDYYLVFVMIFNVLILVKRFKALIDNA